MSREDIKRDLSQTNSHAQLQIIQINLNASESKVLFIYVQLENINFHKALLDTGSDSNLIHSNLVSNLQTQQIAPMKLSSPDGTFLATVTEKISIFWPAINENVTFIVADFDNFPIILGAEVAKKFLKFPDTIQEWNDETMKLQDPIPTQADTDTSPMDIDLVVDTYLDEVDSLEENLEERFVLSLMLSHSSLFPTKYTKSFSIDFNKQLLNENLVVSNITTEPDTQFHHNEKAQTLLQQLLIEYSDTVNNEQWTINASKTNTRLLPWHQT